MIVGFHSPLPPARSGVADYSETLLRYLRRQGKVEISPASADLDIYHLGNNQLHADIYRKALRRPGVVVLHDTVLHHFFLGSLNKTEYTEEFVYNYGSWYRQTAEDLWESRARSAVDVRYFRYPMLRRVCERSKAVIVHNRAAEQAVREHTPAVPVYRVPILCEPKAIPPLSEIENTRHQLRLPEHCFVAGIFGHLRETKRLMTALKVFEQIGSAEFVLLLAGASGSRDLEAAIRSYEGEPFLRHVGFTSERRFRQLAASVDVCINLRYPSAGETSAIGVSMMQLGKPVLFSDDATVSDLPHDCCIRIKPGIAEEAHLGDALRWLQMFPSHRQEIGRRASRHTHQEHAPAKIAEKYWSILCEVATRP